MRTYIIVTILGMIFLSSTVYGQCNNELVEIAMAQSGNDAIFIREFKVKLQKGTAKNPTPAGKYNVFLKENTTYRFNVTSDKSSQGDAILQLFEKGKIVGSTFDQYKGENSKAFEYVADKTGNYQVVISFRVGNSGCAAGVMSIVAQPIENAAAVRKDEAEALETIYMNVDNPVSITTDKDSKDTIIFEIDNGTVYGSLGNYFLRPVSEGLATLRVIIKDEKGKIKEEAKSDFLVRRLPTPIGTIHGLQSGIISRSSLQMADALNINYPVDYEKYGFKVIDFIVKEVNREENRVLNVGQYFSPSLRSFLADIPDETRLVIESIHVRIPGDQIITIEPMAFIVR